MFKLSVEEFESLKSQFATSRWGGTRYLPLGFTEQGVAMLAVVLSNDRAIQVNIAILRTFTHLRHLVSIHKELAKQLRNIEQRVGHHDDDIGAIIELIKQLHSTPEKYKTKIGFH